jgi:peptidoglycan/LPS O-acetylase OafA/YrhL
LIASTGSLAERSSAGSHFQQILGLDLLRFVAAFLVVGYHTGFIVRAPGNPARSHFVVTVEPASAPPLFWFGFVGVPIFFVISGFVIAYSAEYSRPARFFRDRLVRLGPALWLCASLSFVLFLTFSGYAVPVIVKRYIKEMIFYPAEPWLDPVVWTLGIEIVFYGLVFLLLALNRFHLIGDLAAYLAISSLTLHLIMLGVGCNAPDLPAACVPFHKNARFLQLTLLTHGCFFAFGIFLWLWLVKSVSPLRLWWAPLSLMACVLEIVGTVSFEERLDARVHYSGNLTDSLAVAVWLGAMVFMIMAARFNRVVSEAIGRRAQRSIRFVGLTTYPLYLVHNAWLGVFLLPLTALGFALSWSVWLGVICVIILSIVITAWLEPALQARTRAAIDAIGDMFVPGLFARGPRPNHAHVQQSASEAAPPVNPAK